ncbi:MAG: ABC transporter permease, partial [Acidobacteriota bacterium]
DRLHEFERLNRRLPLVRLETSYAGQGHPVPGGFGQAIPGMLTQFMVMIVLIAGTVYLTTEKTTGVLKRLAVAPFTPRTLIAGKLVGLIFLALVQAGLLVGAGTLIGKLHILGAEFYWGSSPGGLLLVILSAAVATAGVTLFLGALLSTPAQASAVGWLAGMAMSGLGGCWWPMEIVPGWLQTVGHVFPTAWTMDALHDLVSFGKGVEAVIPECLFLLAYGLAFSLLGARFLKVEA